MALDPTTVRERLGTSGGKHYWRSLEELTETAEFAEMMHREFPDQAAEWTDPVTRRQFLMLMGASLALAGIAGCSATKPAPAEKIMPYVRQPEGMVLGKPLFFATAMTLGGFATGILVESHEGRPTKVEGNPLHPASLGASDAFMQASVLSLYDPDRSQTVTAEGQPRAWNEVLSALNLNLAKLRQRRGAGLRILTETVTSPTFAHQWNALKEKYPEAQWHQYEPANRDQVLAGSQLAFDQYVNTYYQFKHADVILALDADFLGGGPGYLAYVRDFSERRRVRTSRTAPDKARMNRLYVAESSLTVTGAKADHRFPLPAARIERFARALLAVLRKESGGPQTADLSEAERAWLLPMARDLDEHHEASLVLAGDGQPAAVHALVHAINRHLENVGKTVIYTPPVDVRPENQRDSLRQLVDDMNGRRVDMLVILGGNPVYTAPADVDFAKALEKVAFRLHLGLYQDETAARCHWHIPEAHYLESWSDARAFDGTATIMQPLIAPLYRGKSVHELMSVLVGPSPRPAYDSVRAHWHHYWEGKPGLDSFEKFWQQAVQDGVVPDLDRTYAALGADKVPLKKDGTDGGGAPRAAGLEIVFRPDPMIYDGRFANNGWLQECPKPITKLTWDNAAIMSLKTAEHFGLAKRAEDGGGTPGSRGGEHGRAIVDVIELRYRGRSVRAPVWVVPGHPDDSVTVHLGYGRELAGHVGSGAEPVGFNAYALRDSARPWFDGGLEIVKTGDSYTLACTQMHQTMEGRAPVRETTLDQFRDHPAFAQHKELPGEEEKDTRLHPLTLYEDKPEKRLGGEHKDYRWAMAIDLTACTGCSACVVACQAENNSPVVGKTEVTRGREMHWIRIDRYFEGENVDNPQTLFQPVPCMQCEDAPCELVCPVGATVHSHDGLNDMVYNRCVGTRYCSNNCPYKVRRFNFFQYADFTTASLKLGRNPEVTVRSRGVMEKCTYCVQRIRAADIEAHKLGVELRDGDVLTACQSACPAQAITFGDWNDPQSEVARLKKEPLNYELLGELNTHPRTTYLAALRNPNPRMPKET